LQIVFLTFGLHRQLGYVLRNSMWFGIWFAIAQVPKSWADSSDEWNDQANETVWTEQFLRVHRIVWRLLLSYVLFSVAGLLAALAGKLLSLQFHHENHFQRIQVCFFGCPEGMQPVYYDRQSVQLYMAAAAKAMQHSLAPLPTA
jgi:hypothetical protein